MGVSYFALLLQKHEKVIKMVRKITEEDNMKDTVSSIIKMYRQLDKPGRDYLR